MGLREFLDDYTTLTEHYFAGAYGPAARAAEAMLDRHPERSTQIEFLRACVLGASGNGTDALAVMRSVVEAGGWWPARNLGDPDLDAAHGPEFERLAATMQERWHDELRRAEGRRPKIFVRRPAGSARAALLVLHMYTASAESTAALWERAAGLGILVVVPESTQRDADGLPAWFENSITDRDAASAMEDAAATGLPLVVAGASQGGRAAIRIAMRGVLPGVKGFGAVVSGFPDPPTIEAVPHANARGVRGWLLAGENDGIRGHAEQLHLELVARSFPSRLDVAPETGHFYPADFAERLPDALAFLLAGE